MKVYEIYEQEAAGRPEDELPLTSFSINEKTSLKDCIIIAYVENYTEDEGLCGGSGCDETGNKVYNNLKFLITHISNKDNLTGADTIYNSHDVLAYYDDLPDLCLPRIILTKDNTKAGMPILQQYKDTFVLKDDLYLGISTIIRKFSPRINFQKYGVRTSDIATFIDTIFSDSDDEYVQYRYDLLKDLIETYREIKDYILHELIDKNYFSYQIILKSNETELEKVGEHRYLIPAEEDFINDFVAVMISISGVPCTEDQTISVETTRPDQPVGRLDCSTPYKNRLEFLGADVLLNTIKESYQGQNFGDDIKTRILNPLDAIILNLEGAVNVSSIADGTTRNINTLRSNLINDFYKNPNIDSSFYQSFLALDEIMELVILEMLRCVGDINDDLIASTDKFFIESKSRDEEYVEKLRHTINRTYVNGYTPNASIFKTKVDVAYSSVTKRR